MHFDVVLIFLSTIDKPAVYQSTKKGENRDVKCVMSQSLILEMFDGILKKKSALMRNTLRTHAGE